MFVLHISSLEDISSWQSNAPVNSWYQTQKTRGKTVQTNWVPGLVNVSQIGERWALLERMKMIQQWLKNVEMDWNGTFAGGEHLENTRRTPLEPLEPLAYHGWAPLHRHVQAPTLPTPAPSTEQGATRCCVWWVPRQMWKSKWNPCEIHEQFW